MDGGGALLFDVFISVLSKSSLWKAVLNLRAVVSLGVAYIGPEYQILTLKFIIVTRLQL